ncbi:MAG: DUF5615 family PIN-like protein [Anaerolineae bacterium]|nr:DUF5615 family PIN-like protein [Anaerolineae bacterium]
MPRLKLHLDADASDDAVYQQLLVRGHDVTRTPNGWMPLEASDREQLLGATAHGRAIFTYNVRDFVLLSREYPGHAGIIVAAQRRWRDVGTLVLALDHLLANVEPNGLRGRVCWLNQWRRG